MERADLLRRIRAALEEAFGPRPRAILLYGSEARGQAGADSGIDLLVLLNDQADYWRDVDRCIDVLYPLVLAVSADVAAAQAYYYNAT